MVNKKSLRTRGRIQLSRYFQKFKDGDRVSVLREKSIDVNFPERLQGRTGIVESKVGRAYKIKIKDQNKEKEFLIEPIHLKKIKV